MCSYDDELAQPEQVPENKGTYACPICGSGTVHYHSPEEIAQYHSSIGL